MKELLKYGNRIYKEAQKRKRPNPFISSETSLKRIEDFNEKPYLFVLGCLMNRQINAEKAWGIPYNLCNGKDIKGFGSLANLSKEEIAAWFEEERPHRFNANMSEIFYEGIQRIQDQYKGNVPSAVNAT